MTRDIILFEKENDDATEYNVKCIRHTSLCNIDILFFTLLIYFIAFIYEMMEISRAYT